jgi:malate dehydrogenase (oxaloacetate-decarboxylating)(NADP+)
MMIKREHSLEYHSSDRPGKIELRATKACLTPREIRLAYLPGASFPAAEIHRDPAAAFQYTARGNLVGVITNGTAVPGLGNIGPVAAKPMQEGIAVLFKKLADIDVFDLEIDTTDPDRFVETVRMLEPTFGGISIKDIRAPEGLRIYDQLRDRLRIPVLHENLYSTAVVAAAALINALDLVNKRMEEVQVVLCGAGTVGTGCARLLLRLGVTPGNLLIYDHKGLLHPDRTDLFEFQRDFARPAAARMLAEGMKGADVFIGASAGGVLSLELIRSMNRFPVVFALATPTPEIEYEAARSARQDIIVATALGEFPNAVVDLLSFPYIFRGALDVQATAITENMLLAAARALAELAREDVPGEVENAYGGQHFSFGPDYLLPKPIDPRVLVWASSAVARQAVEDGIASWPVPLEDYQESLIVRMGTGREMLRGIVLRARAENYRVVFPEGTNETILRACGILIDEGIASPILLGREEEVQKAIDHLGLDLHGVAIADPARSPKFESYLEDYFVMTRRRGVIRAAANHRLRQPEYFAAMMLHRGDADMMISGLSTQISESFHTIREIIGTAPGIRRISSHHVLLLPKDVVVLADCSINIDPGAEDLAEIALLAAHKARILGLEPRVAMLSFSNFGNIDHASTKKVRRAAALAKEKAPGLIIDGEMQVAVARGSAFRGEYFPFSSLDRNANVLIFPDLQSANLAQQCLQYMGDATAIGPVLMGTRLPAHYVQYGATVEQVVNLTAIAIVEGTPLRKH